MTVQKSGPVLLDARALKPACVESYEPRGSKFESCRARQKSTTWDLKTKYLSCLRDPCGTFYPQPQPFATRRIVRVPTRSRTRFARTMRRPMSPLA